MFNTAVKGDDSSYRSHREMASKKGGEYIMTQKIKKIGLFLLAVIFVVQPAVAAPLNNDTTTVATQRIIAGALTLQAPSDVTFSDITVSTVNQTVTGNASGWKVDDARGLKTSQQPGWSLTASATNFTDGDPVEPSSIAVTNLTVTPSSLSTISGSSTGVSLGSAHTFTSSSDQTAVAVASGGNGRGRYQGDLGLSLVVPANTPASTYSSTVTFTVQ
jgi:hypothetical protein